MLAVGKRIESSRLRIISKKALSRHSVDFLGKNPVKYYAFPSVTYRWGYAPSGKCLSFLCFLRKNVINHYSTVLCDAAKQ